MQVAGNDVTCKEDTKMELAYQRSTTCVATAACATATGGLLSVAEIGLATDALSTIAAVMLGVPWSLAFRWQPDATWGGVLITVTAMALNIAALWWLVRKMPG
jgi:hypothetical protein